MQKQLEAYSLKDVNRNFFNCGHYPQYVVVDGGTAGAKRTRYPTREAAQARADYLNAKALREWNAFLHS